MKHFDYKLLSALDAVVREGSFERAACFLNITQSAVSQRIKHLEDQIGAILARREHPVQATRIGMIFLKHIDTVKCLEYGLYEALKQEGLAKEYGDFKLNICVNADSLSTWFPMAITKAIKELNIQFNIISNDQEHTIEQLRSGEALAAISANPNPLQGYKVASLGDLQYRAVCSLDFFNCYFAQGMSKEALEIAPRIIYDHKDSILDEWCKQILEENIVCKNAQWIPSFNGYLECCLQGNGWGLVPYITAKPLLKQKLLIDIKPNHPYITPLFWHYSLNAGQFMHKLTAIVTKTARSTLTQL